MNRSKRYVVVAALASSIAVAAGASAVTGVWQSSRCAWDDAVLDYQQIGINRLVQTSHAAVTGVVTNVTPARWNSVDGREFCPSVFDLRGRHQFRDVTVRVATSVFDSATLPAKPGTEVTFRVFGDGTPTGHEVAENADGSVIYQNQVDGSYDLGSTVLVLLAQIDNFPMADGPATVNQVVGSWMGNWTVDLVNNQAVSVQQGRSVPLDKLLARIATERTIGADFTRDRKTALNPLG